MLISEKLLTTDFVYSCIYVQIVFDPNTSGLATGMVVFPSPAAELPLNPLHKLYHF